MSDSNSKKAVTLGVVVILIVVLAGVFFGMGKKPQDALPDTSEVAQEDTTAQTPPPVATDSHGDAVPTTIEEPMVEETTDAAPAEDAVTGEKVKIDLAAFTAARTVGDANAPIKIVEYASLTCSHCAHFHNDVYPELKSKYIDTGKVLFEFREFPLNDPALKATLTARCLPADKYESFVSLLFKTQDHWAGDINYMKALAQNAKLAGMSDAMFEACHAQGDLKLKVADVMQQAQDKWKVASTPTFIINDGAETISGAKDLAEFERVFRKITNDAVGEAPAVE